MEQYWIGFKEIAKYGIILESYRILEYLISKWINFKILSSYHLDYDWYLYTDPITKLDIIVAVSQWAPMAVDLWERYISSWVEIIARIGTTWALVDWLKLWDIAIPYASIKDEGTSGFYINKNAPAIADINFSQKIWNTLENNNLKVHYWISWSTDWRWRETDEMVTEYTNSWAIFADMESSALFSLWLQKKVSVASISVLSDEIHSDIWSEHKGLSDKDVWFNLVLPTFEKIFYWLVKVFSEENKF